MSKCSKSYLFTCSVKCKLQPHAEDSILLVSDKDLHEVVNQLGTEIVKAVWWKIDYLCMQEKNI